MKRGVGYFFERGVFAPFVLAILPVLQLYLININELALSDIGRAMLVSLVVASVLFGALYAVARDVVRAAIIASPFVFFFHLYGDVSDWLAEQFSLGPARADLLVLVVVVGLMSLWVWLVLKRIRALGTLNVYFNILCLFFLFNAVLQAQKKLSQNEVSFNPSTRPVPVAQVESDTPRPDVYYIILDGYGRQDVLQTFYEFDNSAFIHALRERGFYVGEQSSSNYIQTMLSVSSAFNMGYLQELTVNGEPLENRADLIEILNYSQVRLTLAEQGYQTVSFENEYKATIPTADVYVKRVDSVWAQPITAFESIVLDHTLARVLTHIPTFNRILVDAPYETHREDILSTFAGAAGMAEQQGDYLVYAHIIAPHPPFVFDAEGNVVQHDEPFTLFDANFYIKDHSRRNYITGYRNQIQYVNTLTLALVDEILATSETPPIIILQGDHGPGAHLHWGSLENTIPSERFGILNAYYFPNEDYDALYPSISPVNSFRVVLNQFFGTDYPLLPDLHYYSFWSFPFDFTEVTDLSLPK